MSSLRFKRLKCRNPFFQSAQLIQLCGLSLFLTCASLDSVFAVEAKGESAAGVGAQDVLKQDEKFKFLEKQDDINILRHKPIYFAYNKHLTKLQFSFKSPLIQDIPFYFAYSQVIFWKLHEESKPFLDATYNPEFIYSLPWWRSDHFWIDVGPWEHSSNGKSGPDSRSFDQTSIKVHKVWELTSWIIVTAAKLRLIHNVDDQNRDIYDYNGPLEFEFRVIQLFDGWVDKSELTFNINPGGKFSDRFDKGGVQVGYNFRLGRLKMVPAFYVQYYHGYSETLLNYNEKVKMFRAGVEF